ncbi:MAG: glycoside hydrolase family 3 protein [Spirochaetaceae bacterium]|jgi:beta-N-acetylhexosaminidase|nr:glycoside hydrolase family 3 protein [Spirochaetaceae bacterium]
MVFYGLALAFCLCLTGCSEKNVPLGPVSSPAQGAAPEAAEHGFGELISWDEFYRKNAAAALKTVREMPRLQKLSQLFLINLEGKGRFTPAEYDGDNSPLIPGGYLFFSYNIGGDGGEVRDFTASIGDYCREQGLIPPFLALDHEGGLVNRLRAFNPLPSAREVSQSLSPDQAWELYRDQGKLLASLGFHLNLAPVAEAETAENAVFLKNRSYGDAAAVSVYARRAVEGYRAGGIQTALKHFPASTNADPHTSLPELALGLTELERTSVKPFQALLASGPAAVLMAHTRTSLDPDVPACLSRYWVTAVLRERFAFTGLIISDDIYMAALEKNGYPPAQAVEQAVDAGIDVIMLSEKRFLPALCVLADRAALDPDFARRIDQAAARILAFKRYCGITLPREFAGL